MRAADVVEPVARRGRGQIGQVLDRADQEGRHLRPRHGVPRTEPAVGPAAGDPDRREAVDGGLVHLAVVVGERVGSVGGPGRVAGHLEDAHQERRHLAAGRLAARREAAAADALGDTPVGHAGDVEPVRALGDDVAVGRVAADHLVGAGAASHVAQELGHVEHPAADDAPAQVLGRAGAADHLADQFGRRHRRGDRATQRERGRDLWRGERGPVELEVAVGLECDVGGEDPVARRGQVDGALPEVGPVGLVGVQEQPTLRVRRRHGHEVGQVVEPRRPRAGLAGHVAGEVEEVVAGRDHDRHARLGDGRAQLRLPAGGEVVESPRQQDDVGPAGGSVADGGQRGADADADLGRGLGVR